MKRVLVIVVTHNGMHWLERCLSSVYADADLYVWDNDSTDGSADFVQANYPAAKLIRSAENLGFSIPNNKGMQYALDKGYDFAYLLNQDAWLEADALEKLVAAADANPALGLLSPLQMTDGYQSLDKNFNKYYHKKEIKFVMAAHWLIPASALRRVGLFNEELFPLWGQDDDWCQRLDYYGLKIGVIPEARAVHDRAYRKEEKETLVRRNYYTGSLVRLVDCRRPLWERFLFVICFTCVKAVKYASLLPFKYLGVIIGQLPLVKNHRKGIRSRA
jgi:GT2 family glycosyltransferase